MNGILFFDVSALWRYMLMCRERSVFDNLRLQQLNFRQSRLPEQAAVAANTLLNRENP